MKRNRESDRANPLTPSEVVQLTLSLASFIDSASSVALHWSPSALLSVVPQRSDLQLNLLRLKLLHRYRRCQHYLASAMMSAICIGSMPDRLAI